MQRNDRASCFKAWMSLCQTIPNNSLPLIQLWSQSTIWWKLAKTKWPLMYVILWLDLGELVNQRYSENCMLHVEQRDYWYLYALQPVVRHYCSMVQQLLILYLITRLKKRMMSAIRILHSATSINSKVIFWKRCLWFSGMSLFLMIECYLKQFFRNLRWSG